MSEYKNRIRQRYNEENKRRDRKVGMITAVIFFIGMLFLAKEVPMVQRVPLALSIGWTGFNLATYRGRFHPRIVSALKICYPVILYTLLMMVLGEF